MLFLDTSFEIEGLTLFRDYDAPNRFYYMPGSPRLTTDGGQPMFQLLVFRRDITDNPDFHAGDRPGGGFLTLGVDLGVPQSVLDDVKSQLADTVGGDVELAPVPVESGSVRLSALGVTSGAAPGGPQAGPAFVENILGATKPSLYGDERAVFQIEVTQEGAELLRASLQNPGATQIAVIYELAYHGLLPGYQAEIHIDVQQSYSYLHARAAENTLWLKSDVDAEMENLRKQEHITIKDVDYQENDPAKMQARADKLNQLAKDLAAGAFFHPGLTPGTVLAHDRGQLPQMAAGLDNTLLGGVTAPLQAAGSGTGSPGDVAGPRNQAVSAQPAPARVNGDPAPAATGGAANQGSGSPALDAWNRAGRPQASFLLRTLTQEEQQEIVYHLDQIGAVTRTASPQGAIAQVVGGANLPGRIQLVDLDDPFFSKVAGSVTTSADFAAAGVASMVVKLRYGTRDDGSTPKDTKEIVLGKAGDRDTFEFMMDRGKSNTLEYQVVVTYRAGATIGLPDPQVTSDWIPTTTRNLDVDPRVAGAVFPVALTLGAVDWNVVTRVQAQLRYEDMANDVHGDFTALFTTQKAGDQSILIRPRDPSKRAVTVRTTFYYGTTEEVVEQTVDRPEVIVLNPPTARAVPVSVTAVDPLGHYSKITVELSYAPDGAAEQARSIDLAGAAATGSWTFLRPSDDAPKSYRYRVTRFGKDGSTSTDDWQDTTDRALIVGDRFDALFTVEVRFLLADFATIGMQGATLRLDYPEALPGLDPHVEKFFDRPQPFAWKVPHAKSASRAYQWSVEWARSDGTTVTDGPNPSSNEVLLIRPPRA